MLVVRVWVRDTALAVMMAAVTAMVLIAWVLVIYQAIVRSSWPLWWLAGMLGLAWCLVAAVSLWLTVRREELELDRRGLTLRIKVVVPVYARHVPLHELRDVGEYASAVKVNDRRLYGVEVRTTGRPVRFAAGLLPEARAEVARAIREHLAGFQPGAALGPGVEKPFDPLAARPIFERPIGSVEPPADSAWRRVDDLDAVVFVAQGPWRPATVALLGLTTVIWNTVVLAIAAIEWNGLIVNQPGAAPPGFSPQAAMVVAAFGAVGLLLAIAFVVALVEPFRVTRWEFGRDQIRCRVGWFGLGPVWRYPAEAVDCVDAVDNTPVGASMLFGEEHFDPTDESQNLVFELHLIAGERRVCTVPRLSAAEALWMAEVLRRERPQWYRRNPRSRRISRRF